MKRIFSYIFAFATSLAALTAQAQVMTIHHTDGTTTSYKASSIEEITFDEEEEETLPELVNQYGYDMTVIDIKKVYMVEDAEVGGYLFALFSDENADLNEDEPVMFFALPSDSLGKTINLATADMSVLQLTTEGVERATLTGTFRVSFDKFQKNVTIVLNSEDADGHAIRANWSGAFTLAYDAENIYTVTPSGYEPAEYDMVTVFRVKPATTGAATAFAFGNVSATTPDGLKSGNNAVWFSISAAKVGTTIDLSSDTDSYTFKYIDYDTGTVYEEVTSGTITTAQTDGDMVYFTIEATLADGTVISGEYYGTVTDVESLDELIPEVEYGNVILYYDADGNELVNQEIAEVKYATGTDSMYGTEYTTLYFAPEGTTKYVDPQACPALQFTESLVNAGKLNLVDLEDGSLFKIYYKGMQLTSHDDKKYYGYSTYPDNGTLEITRDADGNYEIYLEVTNSYTTTGWGGETTGGDNTKLILSYKGAVSAK